MIELDTIGVININFNDYKDRKIFDLRNKKINLKFFKYCVVLSVKKEILKLNLSINPSLLSSK